MTHESRVEKAAARRKPARPLAKSKSEFQRSPGRLIAKIDAKRGENGLGAALRAGALVRQMRHERGFSQKQLADALGVSQARVSEIEAGAGTQGPTWALMERIASACSQKLGLVSAARETLPLIDPQVDWDIGKEPVLWEVSGVGETYGTAVFHQPAGVVGLGFDKLGVGLIDVGSGRAGLDVGTVLKGQVRVGTLHGSVRTRLAGKSDE